MAFSEQLKQRAIELSLGRSAGEVLRVLNREFSQEDLPDERTVRRWWKTSVVHSVTNIEHQEQLADIVDILLTDLPDSTVYESNDVTEELSRDDVVGILEHTFESACRKYSDWFFYSCFYTHLVHDFPNDYRARSYWEFVYEKPHQLIGVLRKLAASKTFKGTCPVCKDW